MNEGAHPALIDRIATLEAAIARMREVEEIRRLRERYCIYVDARRWDDLAAVLTPDYEHFSTNTPGADPVRVATTAQAFLSRLARLTAGSTTVHACFMPDIALTSPTTASGSWSMTDVVSHPSDPAMRFTGRGRYLDSYRKGDDGIWRIAVTRLHRQRLDPLPLREADSAPGLPEPQEGRCGSA